jgi:hypothetical protein
MKKLVLGLISISLIYTVLHAGVKYIEAQNNKVYSVGCDNGSFGEVSNDDGMICATSNTGKNKCSYDWGIQSAASWMCN